MEITLKDILLVMLGAALCGLFITLYYWRNCEDGSIEMMKNPNDDPDNPYVLAFNVNPERWLRKKYVVLKVRRKSM